jgi:hypothetical protein
MKSKTKLALQLLGLTVWATAWIGGGLLLLKRAIEKDEQSRKKGDTNGRPRK